jgi:hypothetical protein
MSALPNLNGRNGGTATSAVGTPEPVVNVPHPAQAGQHLPFDILELAPRSGHTPLKVGYADGNEGPRKWPIAPKH